MIKIGNKTIYTINEATEMLHLSYQTIRKYITTGLLKGQKVGTKWYVTEASIQELAFGDDAGAPSVVSSDTGEEVK